MRFAFCALFSAMMVAFAQAQGNYLICDTTEVCICNDGSSTALTYNFIPCQPGQVLTLVYCCGVIPDSSFVTLFNGLTISAPPMGTYTQASAFGAQQFISTDLSGGLVVRVSFSPASTLSCAMGDYPPLVIGLYSGMPQPPPPPPAICPLAAACCLTTEVQATRRTAELVFTYSQGALHCSSIGFVGETELREASGRFLQSHRWRGEAAHAIGDFMPRGAYVLVVRDAERTVSRLIIID